MNLNLHWESWFLCTEDSSQIPRTWQIFLFPASSTADQIGSYEKNLSETAGLKYYLDLLYFKKIIVRIII